MHSLVIFLFAVVISVSDAFMLQNSYLKNAYSSNHKNQKKLSNQPYIPYKPYKTYTTTNRVLELYQSSQLSDDDPPKDPFKFFVAGFIAVWAVGYSLLAYVETSGPGLGDLGGYIGAGFAILLIFGLLGVPLYEVFKPE